MPKSVSPFTGVKLTEQTPFPDARLDQRLFSPAVPRPVPKPQSTQTDEIQEGRKEGKKESRKEGIKEGEKEASLPGKREEGPLFDLNDPPFQKANFLFTNQEFEALEDLKLDLRRTYDVKASKQDLARCAIHQLIEDYRQQGEASVVVRRLKSKRLR